MKHLIPAVAILFAVSCAIAFSHGSVVLASVAGAIALFGAYMGLRILFVAGTAMAFSRRSRLADRYRIYRRNHAPGQFASELQATIAALILDATVVGIVRYFDLIQTAPSWYSALYTFFILFVWFEIWFYTTHRLLHTPALYFIHRQHHVAKVTSPLSAMSFSVLERLLLITGSIGFAVALSQVLPLSYEGLAAYFFLNYVINVFGHTNVELFSTRFINSRLARLIVTPTFHAMHHARVNGHYGLFTATLDHLFDTAWKDYPQVFMRARTGNGLTKLGERLDDNRVHQLEEITYE